MPLQLNSTNSLSSFLYKFTFFLSLNISYLFLSVYILNFISFSFLFWCKFHLFLKSSSELQKNSSFSNLKLKHQPLFSLSRTFNLLISHMIVDIYFRLKICGIFYSDIDIFLLILLRFIQKFCMCIIYVLVYFA